MSTQTARPSTADTAKRRGQALAGALAGLALVIVLTVVFFVVKANKSDKPAAASPQPAAAATSPAPAEAPPSAEPTAPQPANVNTPPALSKEPDVKGGKGTVSKLAVTTLVPGTGAAVQKGQTITANYKLVSYKTGQVLDSSWSRGQAFSTPIGVGAVIKGWDDSIPGQKIGSRIQIDVPAALAYGAEQGDLRFVVDLLAAK
jgi:peptidylprolyl isomerase